jgi:hypothetical protein
MRWAYVYYALSIRLLCIEQTCTIRYICGDFLFSGGCTCVDDSCALDNYISQWRNPKFHKLRLLRWAYVYYALSKHVLYVKYALTFYSAEVAHALMIHVRWILILWRNLNGHISQWRNPKFHKLRLLNWQSNHNTYILIFVWTKIDIYKIITTTKVDELL